MIYLFILLLILGVVLAIAIHLRQRSQHKPIIERESMPSVTSIQSAAGTKSDVRRKADFMPTSLGSSPYSVLIVR